MPAGLDGDFQLGADAIGGGNQDRILEPGGLEVEQRAKTAQRGIGTLAAGGGGQRLDRIDESLAGIDIDSGGFIKRRRVDGALTYRLDLTAPP
jgi:hypothetical protein